MIKRLIYKLKHRFIFSKCESVEAHRWVTKCPKCKYYNPSCLDEYHD